MEINVTMKERILAIITLIIVIVGAILALYNMPIELAVTCVIAYPIAPTCKALYDAKNA